MARREIQLDFLIGAGADELKMLKELSEGSLKPKLELQGLAEAKTQLESLQEDFGIKIGFDAGTVPQIEKLSKALQDLPKGEVNIDVKVNTRTLERSIKRIQELTTVLKELQQFAGQAINIEFKGPSAFGGGGGNGGGGGGGRRTPNATSGRFEQPNSDQSLNNRRAAGQVVDAVFDSILGSNIFGGSSSRRTTRTPFTDELSFGERRGTAQRNNENRLSRLQGDEFTYREFLRRDAEQSLENFRSAPAPSGIHNRVGAQLAGAFAGAQAGLFGNFANAARLSGAGFNSSEISNLLEKTDEEITNAIRTHIKELKERIERAVKTARRTGLADPGFDRELQGLIGLDGPAGDIAKAGFNKLRNAESKGDIALKRAQKEFDIKLAPSRFINNLFGNPEENEFELESLAQKFDVDKSKIKTKQDILGQGPKAFDLRRAGSPEVAQQLLFAGLFGGAGSFGLGLLGAGLGGPTGAFAGSVIGQAVDEAARKFFETMLGGIEHITDSALEFSRSVSGVAAILQATTVADPSLTTIEQVGVNVQKARAIQLASQQALATFGIGGESQAALTQALFAGAAQKGVILNQEQSTTILTRLGGAIQALRPDIANNPTLIRRDFEDILSGSPVGKRTQAGIALRNFAPELFGGFNTGEELLRATAKLEQFVTAVQNSGQGALQLVRIMGELNSVFTVFSDAVLQSAEPALKALADTLADPLILDASRELGKALGEIGGEFIKLGGGVAKGAVEGVKQFTLLLDSLAVGFARLTGNTDANGNVTVGNKTYTKSGAVITETKTDDFENESTPEGKINRFLREAGIEAASSDYQDFTEKLPEFIGGALGQAQALLVENVPNFFSGGDLTEEEKLLIDKIPPSFIGARLNANEKNAQQNQLNTFDPFFFDQGINKSLINREFAEKNVNDAESVLSQRRREAEIATERFGADSTDARAANASVKAAERQSQADINALRQAEQAIIQVLVERRQAEQSLRNAEEASADAIQDEVLKRNDLTRSLAEAVASLSEFKAGLSGQFASKNVQIIQAAQKVRELGGSTGSYALEGILDNPDRMKEFELAAAQAELAQLGRETGLGSIGRDGGPQLIPESGGSFQLKLKNQQEQLQDAVTGIEYELERLPRAVRSAMEALATAIDTILPRLTNSSTATVAPLGSDGKPLGATEYQPKLGKDGGYRIGENGVIETGAGYTEIDPYSFLPSNQGATYVPGVGVLGVAAGQGLNVAGAIPDVTSGGLKPEIPTSYMEIDGERTVFPQISPIPSLAGPAEPSDLLKGVNIPGFLEDGKPVMSPSNSRPKGGLFDDSPTLTELTRRQADAGAGAGGTESMKQLVEAVNKNTEVLTNGLKAVQLTQEANTRSREGHMRSALETAFGG